MINPFPLVWAIMRRHAVVSITFVLLIALAVGIGAAITAQERALRSGSARASDKFDLIVGAPGSQIDLLLRVVFLQPGAVELLAGEPERKLLSDQKADFVAPIGFGDSYEGHPIVGTIPQLVMHLSGEQLAEGRNFETPLEAVIGADTDLKLGDVFHATHGEEEIQGEEHEHEHEQSITVVGRMAPTGTPWDRAILTPIELTWMVHELGNGHGDAPLEKVGPPFDLDTVPGIPAAVVKPKTVAGAYGLRGEYRTPQTTAFFPAEVLVQLYELIGDVRVVMSGLAIATEVLLVAAISALSAAALWEWRQSWPGRPSPTAMLATASNRRCHLFVTTCRGSAAQRSCQNNRYLLSVFKRYLLTDLKDISLTGRKRYRLDEIRDIPEKAGHGPPQEVRRGHGCPFRRRDLRADQKRPHER